MRRTQKVLLRQHGVDGSRRVPDEVIVEEPLEIRLDGEQVSTTMRTPGNDFDLAVGFLHAEGLLDGAKVTGVRYCGTGSAVATEFNVVTVETDGRGPGPTPRLGPVGSACGVCGADQIVELAGRLRPLDSVPELRIAGLVEALNALGDLQDLHGRTGGSHAAALVDPAGQIELIREDIGRHNAVDKVVGALRLGGRLADVSQMGPAALFVTSRASFEMVQKAWAAGIGTVVAAGAPSALAIDTAQTAGMNLVAFARGESFNVYAGSVGT